MARKVAYARVSKYGTPCLLYDELLGKGGGPVGGGGASAAGLVHCDAHVVNHLVSKSIILYVQEVLIYFI